MAKRPAWAAALLVFCLYLLPAPAYARWCDGLKFFGFSLCSSVDIFLSVVNGPALDAAKELDKCLSEPDPVKMAACAAGLGISDPLSCFKSFEAFEDCAKKAALKKGVVTGDPTKASSYWGVGPDKEAACFRQQKNYYMAKKKADRAETAFHNYQTKFDNIVGRHERGLLRLRSKVSQSEGEMLGVLAEFGISVAQPFLNKVTCEDVALEQFCADLKQGETVKLARKYARALGVRSSWIKQLLNTDKAGLPRIERAQGRYRDAYNQLVNNSQFEFQKYKEMRFCQAAVDDGSPRLTPEEIARLNPEPYIALVAKPNGSGCWEIPFTGIIFC